MKNREEINELVVSSLTHLKDHIIKHEKKNLISISNRLGKSINSIVLEYTGYEYDYLVFNGQNLQFIAKNILDSANLRSLNCRHYEVLTSRINKDMNEWIESEDFERTLEVAELAS